MSPLAQTPHPNLKNVAFILNYTKPLVIAGFEQLSSSIYWRVMAKVWPERANYAFAENLEIRPKTGFLAHNFGHRCASRSIKDSIDVDFHCFQQNFEPKEWVNGLGPRAGQRWPKFPKHVLFVTSPPEKKPPKKIVFYTVFWLQDLLNSKRVWTAL